MKFFVSEAIARDASTLEVTLRFEQVQGADVAADVIENGKDAMKSGNVTDYILALLPLIGLFRKAFKAARGK